MLNRGARRVDSRCTDTALLQKARFEQENELANLIEQSGSGRGAEIYHLGSSCAGWISKIFRVNSPRKNGGLGTTNWKRRACPTLTVSAPSDSLGTF